MALSDLAVFSENLYTVLTEVTRQQIELFNAASRGVITLSNAAVQGDYSEKAFYAKISGLVRRRNPYGSGTVASKTLAHLIDTMVKVAAGTPPVRMDPSQFKWIQRNPAEAAAAVGQQLSKDMLQDMLNIGCASALAALGNISGVVYDATGDSVDTLNAGALNKALGKFGDRRSEIAAWIAHSYGMESYFSNAIANTTQLFTYGTVNVIADPFGKVFIVSDIPSLFTSGSPNIAYSLGLVPGAITLEQNNDFTDNYETSNGDENIIRTYQAEWSYMLGIKGFSWDKTTGGKAPNDAALTSAANWDKIVTDNKDLAGVVCKTN